LDAQRAPQLKATVGLLLWNMAKAKTQVYAIVRLDDSMINLEEGISVKEVVWSLKEAEAEVERLNELNGSKGSKYFFRTTRLIGDRQADGKIRWKRKLCSSQKESVHGRRIPWWPLSLKWSLHCDSKDVAGGYLSWAAQSNKALQLTAR
jgi:hypothetical protein